MNAESIGRSIFRVELIADPNFSKNCLRFVPANGRRPMAVRPTG